MISSVNNYNLCPPNINSCSHLTVPWDFDKESQAEHEVTTQTYGPYENTRHDK